MVRVVAILPPVDREAREVVANKIGEDRVQPAVLREIVVAEIVAKPAELLVTETNEDRANDPPACRSSERAVWARGRAKGTGDSKVGAQNDEAHSGREFVNVVGRAGLKPALRNELLTELAKSGDLGVNRDVDRLAGHAFELGKSLRPVEAVEDVGGILLVVPKRNRSRW